MEVLNGVINSLLILLWCSRATCTGPWRCFAKDSDSCQICTGCLQKKIDKNFNSDLLITLIHSFSISLDLVGL